MCGVSLVYLNNNGSNQYELLNSAINKMLASQVHRGPDMQDNFIDKENNLALGHNRLSIIDLSKNSIQPMASQDERYYISYNGEIYNFLDLKRELIKLGYQFKSTSDTEVILYGYAEWGKKLFNKLNGMWAICILDRKLKSVTVSRDRFGIKPVYYYHGSNKFILASEVKAILSTNLVAREVSYNGLNEYFSFQNIISEHTLFNNIFMLKPGHNLELDLRTGKINISEYWDIDFDNYASINEGQFCDELYNTLSCSVKKQMISDVPVGATISGGMDSSTIIAVASEQIPHIKTFTGYFDHSNIDANERSTNEHMDARLISEKFRTEHYERLIRAYDVKDTLGKIVWHLEDPKVGMCYTFYLINQLLSNHVTVNLSGTGGDELLGGYPWRYKLISDIRPHNKFINIYYNYWSRLVADHEKKDFFAFDFFDYTDIAHPRNEFEKIVNIRRSDTSLNKALYYEVKTFLHGMLMVEDKMGMAHSVETRFPFLDNDLVALTCKIPEPYKYENHEAKLLLKKAFGKYLPEQIINKKKQGFTPPDMTWYRRDLKSFIEGLLLNPKSDIGKYINPKYIQKTLSSHYSGQDNRLMIWSLIFFAVWLEVFINNDNVNYSPISSELDFTSAYI